MSTDWVSAGVQEAEAPRERQAVPQEELNPFELLNALLRSWRVIAILMLGSAALATLYWARLPWTYTASAAFVPESRTQSRGVPSGLAGLMGQFGVAVGPDASQSPRFYAAVLKGRELLERILLTGFPDPRGGAASRDSVTLLQLLGVEGRSPADLRQGLLFRHALLLVQPIRANLHAQAAQIVPEAHELSRLRDLPARSVQLIVTSPPYRGKKETASR